MFLLSFLALTISVFARGMVPSRIWKFGALNSGPFLLMLAISAVWIISYAVYVSDYSRYLPRETSKAQTFWYTYAGGAISSVWLLAFGALLGIILPKAISDTALVTIGLAGPVKVPFMVIVALGVIFTDALNTYGASMCLLTITEQRRPLLGTGRPARIGTALTVGIVGTVIGIAASSNFVTDYSNFLSLLFYFLIPWSAINLIDFYIVTHGVYPLMAFFRWSGPYRGIRWWAVLSYVVACVVEIPFWSTTIYTGPVATALNGGDITWIIGLIVAGGLYYIGARLGRVQAVGEESGMAEVPTQKSP
jgi:NCS1 family nucleobase:cation symporter-1